MSWISTALATIIFTYVVALVLVNRIPRVCIARFGWLSLKKVSISLNSADVKFESIGIRLNLTKETGSPFKFFHLDFKGVSINLKKSLIDKVADHSKPSSYNDDHNSPQAHHDAANKKLEFNLSKKVFKYVFVRKLINQVLLHIFHSQLTIEGCKEKFVLDYLRLENSYFSNGSNRFIISIYNTYLVDTANNSLEEQARVIRSAEFLINVDIGIDEKAGKLPKHLRMKLLNFNVALSLGKLNLPMDSINNVRRALKAIRSPSNSKKKLDIEAKRRKFENASNLIQNVFHTLEIKLEDFRITKRDYEVKISNISTSVSRNTKGKVKFQFYLVSTRLYHKQSNCFELPSLSQVFEYSVDNFSCAIALMVHNNDSKSAFNLFERLMITGPVFNVYYDQIEAFSKAIDEKKQDESIEKEDIGIIEKQAQKEKIKTLRKEKMEKLITFMGEISAKFTLVDMKINIHLPPGDGRKFNRTEPDNAIILTYLSVVSLKFLSNAENSNLTGVLKLKSLRMNAFDNTLNFSKIVTFLNYSITDHKVSTRIMLNKVHVSSINQTIFHLARRIRNWHNTRFNTKYAEKVELAHSSKDLHDLVNGDIDQSNKSDPKADAQAENFIKIFEMVPHFISKIKFDLTKFQADIVCKDNLPSVKVFDDNIGKEVDLSDFKIGISLQITDGHFRFVRSSNVIKGGVGLLELFTLTDYADESVESHGTATQNEDEDDIDNRSEVSDDFSDADSIDSTLGSADSGIEQRARKVYTIRNITVSNNNDDKDIDKLFIRIPEADLKVTTFLIFCTFYAVSLLKFFGPTVHKVCTSKEMAALSGPKKHLKFDILVDSVAILARLPNNADALIEIDTLRTFNALKLFKADYVRLYVPQPLTKLWERALIIKSVAVNIGKNKDDGLLDIHVDTKGIRLHIPFQFPLYTIIDNIITLVKAQKQIKHNITSLMNKKEWKRILPKSRDALVFPYVKITLKSLLLTIEADAFENELSGIFEFGKKAQEERILLQSRLDEKADAMREELIEERIELKDSEPNLTPVNLKTSSPPKHIPMQNPLALIAHRVHGHNSAQLSQVESVHENPHVFAKPKTKEEIEHFIQTAQDNLNEIFSATWVNSYRVFKKKKDETREKKLNMVWKEDMISKTMRSKFDIIGFTRGVPMFAGLFRGVDLELLKARIDDLDKFIYEKAKGQPKLNYSILAPLYASLKCSLVHFLLRDYPLPLLLFPFNENEPVFHLRGNIVINEKLVEVKEELRYIWVPFMPIAKPRGMGPDELPLDCFYLTFVARTLAPVKFILDLECDLTAEKACSITWCKSYVAALLSTMMAFDNFTKPQVDDSPLGWWDKLSLNMHGGVKVNIANEICLHMKSSLDPYLIIGTSSGLVFSWRLNVKLQINPLGKWDEFMTVTSDDFMLAIPNYLIAELSTWSLYLLETTRRQDEDVFLSESKKYLKRIMTLLLSQKVKWKVGLLFERNVDNNSLQENGAPILSSNQKRTDKFKPHYEVQVTNPMFKYHPDSYENFRSHYLHLAILVESEGGDSHNAIFLTPMALHYFFDWWHIMTKAHLNPIRRGHMFASALKKKTVHVKMGLHLFTLKYQLKLSPLTLSLLYKHSTSDELDRRDRVAFTGIKGKFDSCVIDLHQKKLPLVYVNRKLNINHEVLHLKMNEGCVDINGADIRVVKAVFNEQLINGMLASQLGDSKLENSLYEESSGENSQTHSVFNEWVDQEDFVELEERDLLTLNPRITVLPFFSLPQFSYVREFMHNDEGKYPFGSEKSHDCEIGKTNPEVVQVGLIKERLSQIYDRLNQLEDKAAKIKSPEAIKKIERDILEFTHRRTVVHDLLNRVEDEMNDCASVASAESSYTVLRLTTYALHHLQKSQEVDLDLLMNQGASKYHNRFIIHNMKLLWDKKLSKIMLDFSQKVRDRKQFSYFLSKQALDFVDSIVHQVDDPTTQPPKISSKPQSDFCRTGDEVIKTFENDFSAIEEGQEVERNYLVKLIHPQIKISKPELQKRVLILSRDLELRALTVNREGLRGIMSIPELVAGKIENRYGVLFQDSHMFVMENSNVDWFDFETCFDASWHQDELVCERNSMAMLHVATNPLSEVVAHESVTKIHLTKIVISATANQYATIMSVIDAIMQRSKTKQDRVLERLSRVISLSDAAEFEGIDKRVIALQKDIKQYRWLLLNLTAKGIKLNSEEERQVTCLQLEFARVSLELLILMRLFELANFKNSGKRMFSKTLAVFADQVVIHILDSQRDPLVDFALARLKFSKLQIADGSITNRISIHMLQGFDLRAKSVYPELLRPMEETKRDVVEIQWTKSEPVGGISVIQNAKISIQPLKVELDYETATSLQKYFGGAHGHKKKKTKVEESDSDSDSETEDITKNGSSSGVRKSSESHHSALHIDTGKEGFMRKLRNKVRHRIDDNGDSSSDASSIISSGARSGSPAPSNGLTPSSPSRDKDREHLDHKEPRVTVEDDISVAINRSSNYRSISDLKIELMKLMISLKTPKHLNVIDLHQLVLTVPLLRYKNKVWLTHDLVLRLKKDMIKVVFAHLGKIISNKFKVKKRLLLSTPLKQVDDYSQFMSVKDLQEDGRARDYNKTEAEHTHSDHLKQHKQHHHKRLSVHRDSGQLGYGDLFGQVEEEEEEEE